MSSTNLFERPLPPGYRDELQALLAERPEELSRNTTSLLLFRLGGLHLAIPTRTASAIAPVLHIARIPHRSGTVLLGLAAFRGQILPCCSLARLLDVEQQQSGQARTLILEEAPGRRWAVPIDELLGVRLSEIVPLTAATTLSPESLRGEIHEPDGIFAVLDTDILFRQITLATG